MATRVLNFSRAHPDESQGYAAAAPYASGDDCVEAAAEHPGGSLRS